MPEPRPHTGPVTLPSDPKAVADGHVHGLASLGVVNRPPSEREYEHAALDVALDGSPEEHVYAVLSHLDGDALQRLQQGVEWLHGAVETALLDRGPQG